MLNNFIIKILIVFLFMLPFSVDAEEFIDNAHTFNSYENPIYYKYFDEYMNTLGEEFGKIKFHRANIFVQFHYKIFKDGTINNIKVSSLTNSPMNMRKLKSIVEINLPPKFYEGMNKDYLVVDVVFSTNSYVDDFTIDYLPKRVRGEDCFLINLDRKI